MLRWPDKARVAIVRLFRPLQDIDVYVEDAGDEVFYGEVLKRLTSDGIRVSRVVSLGNRKAVVEAAKVHDFSKRRALFLIDGDFPWVRDEEEDLPRGVHRLDAYCIENLLFDEHAAIQLIVEDEQLSVDDARARLDFPSWIAAISEPLVHLFTAFAICNLLKPEVATVSEALDRVLTAPSRGAVPDLDGPKARQLAEGLINMVGGGVGADQVAAIRETMRRRVGSLAEPLRIVSGKDFLLPLLDFRMRCKANCKIKRKAMRLRLARHCPRERFSGLADALSRASWL